MENNLTMSREILKNKEIQGEEFNMNESRHYNVSNKPSSGLRKDVIECH